MLITNTWFQSGTSLRQIQEAAEASGIEILVQPEVTPFSTEELVDKLLEISRISYIEAVIGFGDDAALSVARAVAVLHGSVLSAQELRSDAEIRTAMLPYLEIPTVFSTHYFFRSSVILADRSGRGVRFADIPGFNPRVLIQDPGMLKEVSRKQRLASLLETLLLAVEGYFSKDATFFSDTLLLRGIGLSLDTLPQLLEKPDDLYVLHRGMQAGFFTAFGMAMSSPGWGIGSAQVLARLQKIPSAIVATILLPFVLEYGLKVCPEKVARMGNMLGENIRGLSVVAAADRVVDSIRASLGVEQMPGRLSELGIEERLLNQAASQVMELPFIQSLPTPMGLQELVGQLKTAF